MRSIQCLALAACASVLPVAGCLSTSGDLDEFTFRCDDSKDCGQGYQCDSVAAECVRALEDERGVSADEIALGMTGPFETPESLVPISEAARDGVEAYFAQVNAAGGIHGRRLRLVLANDNYSAETAAANVSGWINEGRGQIFSVLSVIGTPASLAVREIAKTERILFFAPGSGADALEKNPPDRHVFNVRLRYSQEAEQLTNYMTQVLEPAVPATNIAVFAQGTDDAGNPDSFGVSGVDGTLRALRGVSASDVHVATYGFDAVNDPFGREVSPVPAVAGILRWAAQQNGRKPWTGTGPIPVGIVMTALATPAVAFIKVLSDQIAAIKLGGDSRAAFLAAFGAYTEGELERLARVELQFATLSPVPAQLVAGALKGLGGYETKKDGKTVQAQYGAGLIVASNVPDVSSGATGVVRFIDQLEAYNPELVPNAFSLEGYLVARLLGEALELHGRDIATESFIDTLESMNGSRAPDLGINAVWQFSQQNHQAASRLWGLRLDDTLQVQDLGVLLEDG